jgi:hypothetical protein
MQSPIAYFGGIVATSYLYCVHNTIGDTALRAGVRAEMEEGHSVLTLSRIEQEVGAKRSRLPVYRSCIWTLMINGSLALPFKGAIE